MAIKTVKLTLNGVEYTGAQDGDEWLFEIAAPGETSFHQPGGYYDLKLQATSADNLIAAIDSKDSQFGEYLRLFVREPIIPTIEILYPDDGAHVPEETPRIRFEIRDEPAGSGINLSTMQVELDGVQINDINITPAQNGYDCDFIAPTLALGIHTIAINVKDNDENSAVFIQTFTRGLIFDRTQADIDMALALMRQNIPLPSHNLKIGWDWRALNRIERFCAELVTLFNKYGYKLYLPLKTDWTTEDENSIAESQRILNNINTMRKTFTALATTPNTPLSPSRMTHIDANAVERILHDIYVLLSYVIQDLTFTAETHTGEDDWF